MNEYRSHLSVTLWVVLASLAIGLLITTPERVWTLSVLGSPIDFKLSASLLAGLVAVAATWAGLEAALRTHPRQDLVHHSYRFWGLPTAIVLTAAVLLPSIQQPNLWLIILALSGAALAASMAGEYHTLDPAAPEYANARLLLNGLAYAVAGVAFILIYLSRSRSLVSATLVGGMAGLLALDLLRSSQKPLRLALLYSAMIALLLAEFTTVLNYWPFPSVRVALILLMAFYLLVGTALQALSRQLNRRSAFEYLIIASIIIVVIFFFPA